MTAADRAAALDLARGLVGARLVACVNVLDGATSVYWWDGAAQEDAETVLIAKTTADLVDRVVAWVTAHHAYDCPCVVAVPIETGNPAFLNWIAAETAAAHPR